MKKTRSIHVLLVAVAGLAVVATSAHAEPEGYVEIDVMQEQERERQGMMLSVGAGIGHLALECDVGCEGTNEAAGVHLSIGMMPSNRLGIVGDLWLTGHREEEVTVMQGLLTVGPQVWLTDRLWARAGVGAARARVNYEGDIIDAGVRSDTMLAVMGGAGFEVISRPNFALNLQLRAGNSFLSEFNDTRIRSLAVGLGVSWF